MLAIEVEDLIGCKLFHQTSTHKHIENVQKKEKKVFRFLLDSRVEHIFMVKS